MNKGNVLSINSHFIGIEDEVANQIGNLVDKRGLVIIVFHADTPLLKNIPGLLEAVVLEKCKLKPNGKIILLGIKTANVSEVGYVGDIEYCHVYMVLSDFSFRIRKADFSNPMNKPVFDEIRREIASIGSSLETPLRDADLEAIQRAFLAAKDKGLTRTALLTQITGILTNN